MKPYIPDLDPETVSEISGRYEHECRIPNRYYVIWIVGTVLALVTVYIVK